MTVTNDCRLYVSCVTQTVARNGGGVDLWARAQVLLVCVARAAGGRGGGAYTRASSSEFCYPILD